MRDKLCPDFEIHKLIIFTTAKLVLSEARANTVRNYLIEKGIAPGRVTAKGYGLSKPIADNRTEDGRAQNRRTEVTVLENAAQ